MKDFDWLANLACDCYDFGERHDLHHIVSGANSLIDALEKDLGLKFHWLPRIEAGGFESESKSSTEISNIVPFPSWRRNSTKPMEFDQPEQLPAR